MQKASGQARSSADSDLGAWCFERASAADTASSCCAAAAPCSSTAGWRLSSARSALGYRSPAARRRSACADWPVGETLNPKNPPR